MKKSTNSKPHDIVKHPPKKNMPNSGVRLADIGKKSYKG